VLGLVLVATLAIPQATAQTPLSSYLGSLVLGREGKQALERLERTSIPRQTLQNLLSSRGASPYLRCSLPRIADLAELPGMGDLVARFASNGQGVAYEIAVAHAYRSNITSVSAFLRGNELDGTLRSGTVIESKSAQPRRPEHLLLQLRRRAEGGQKVILALGYRPSSEQLRQLRALSSELDGRVEVHHIPLRGSSYEVLVEGRNIENPCNRQRVDSLLVPANSTTRALRTAARAASSVSKNRPERSWISRALDRQGSRSIQTYTRGNLRASTSRR
jgi:hypothetical protein